MNKKNTSFKELSELIVKVIEDEPYFNKETLIPKVKSIISAFNLNLNNANYNKIETPSDAQRRLMALERTEREIVFWKSVVKELIGEDIKKYYNEADLIKIGSQFNKLDQ